MRHLLKKKGAVEVIIKDTHQYLGVLWHMHSKFGIGYQLQDFKININLCLATFQAA
jgi:hypothetical protein